MICGIVSWPHTTKQHLPILTLGISTATPPSVGWSKWSGMALISVRTRRKTCTWLTLALTLDGGSCRCSHLDLTSPSILSRCLQKRTQNTNESLHSKLWRLGLKVKDCKLERVWFNTWDKVLIHSFGSEKGNLLDHLGLANEKIPEKKRKQELHTPTIKPQKHQQRDDSSYRAVYNYAQGEIWCLSFSLSEATVST